MTALVFSAVNNATHVAIPKHSRIPKGVSTIFNAFNKVHRLWWWYRRAKIYTNPDNFLKLAAGHTANFLAGRNILMRVAAQCVLIVTKILDCVEVHVDLYQSCCNFGDLFKNRFTKHHTTDWCQTTKGFFSPTTIYWWKSAIRQVLQFVKEMALRTFFILKNIFRLSMVTTDAVNSFSLSPETRNEAINEFFVNATRWLDKLADNQELLISKLDDHRDIIEKFLKGIGSRLTPEKLIKGVTNAISKTAKVYGATKKVLDVANGLFKDILKRGVFGFMQAIGLIDYLPNAFVPPIDAPWMKEDSSKEGERGPPEILLTRPSKLTKTQQKTRKLEGFHRQ